MLLAAISSGVIWSAALAHAQSQQDAAVPPAAGAVAAVDPAAPAIPAGEALRAVFIDVAGKVQWRASDTAPWRDAKVNDVVEAGVEVRTGLRSHAAIRIGRNATALIDAGTLFQLPTVVQEGDTLRTAAAVKHGRADFKVDKVGLSNDFKVVTPSTTLAVRGTEFAVATGPLKQVEVIGARRNAINAIELKYSLNNTTVQMSSSAASSSSMQNPAHSAVVAASAPASGTGLPTTSQGEAVQNAASGPAPTQAGSAAQATSANRTTARAEKAAGRAGGNTSAVGRILEQVADANAKIDQAIEYLLQADDEFETLDARRDALQALQGLATLRRDEARAALAQHEYELSTANEQGAIADDAITSFDERAARVGNAKQPATDSHFRIFDDERAQALDALASIRDILGGIGQSESSQQLAVLGESGNTPVDPLSELVEEARRAIMAMGDAHQAADGERSAMDSDRGDLDAVIASMDQTTRVGAQAAISSYQEAVAGLNQAVQSGAAVADVAASAHAAVVQLNELVQQLRAASPTERMTGIAAESLARLVAATSALDRTYVALTAVQTARAAATDDARAESFGLVEQLYGRLLEARVRIVAEWAAIDSGVSLRGGQLNEAVADAEQVFGGVGSEFANRSLDAGMNAAAAREFAELRTSDAATAAEQEESAFADSQALFARATSDFSAASIAANQLDDASSEFQELSGGAVAALAALKSPNGDRAVLDTASAALDAMNAALDGVLARALDVESSLQNSVTNDELTVITARAADAVNAILLAYNDVESATATASVAATDAGMASAAAQQLNTAAQELAARFGMSAEFVSTAAQAAALLANGASDDATRASSASALVRALLQLAQEDRTGGIAPSIEALIAMNSELGEQAAAARAQAIATAVSRNAAGIDTFGGVVSLASEKLAYAEQFANTRSGTALDALASHDAISANAEAIAASADAAALEFGEHLAVVGSSEAPESRTLFAEFDAERGNAVQALELIRGLLGNGNSGEGEQNQGEQNQGQQNQGQQNQGQQYQEQRLATLLPGSEVDPLVVVIGDLQRALLAMASAQESAVVERDGMSTDKDAFATALQSLNSSARIQAKSAIADYQQAVQDLDSAVTSGEDKADVASRARDVVEQLQLVVAALVELDPTSEAVSQANVALQRLDAANAALARSMDSLDAVRTARATATDDARAEALGQVEALFEQLVNTGIQLVADLSAVNGGLALRGEQLASTVQDSEDVLGGVGSEFLLRSLAGSDAAAVAALEAETRAGDAEFAAASEQSAFDAASELHARTVEENAAASAAGQQVQADLQALHSSADEVASGLASLERLNSSARYLGSDAVIEALNAVNDAFYGSKERSTLGVAGGAAALETRLSSAVSPTEMVELTAQATAAIDSILEARAAVDAASLNASSSAESTARAAASAQQLVLVTQELGTRFGLSTEFVGTAARASALSATAAADAESRSMAAQRLVSSLALLAEQRRVEAIAGNIDALIAANGSISSQAAADLLEGQARYSAVNEAGAVTFGRFTVGAANEAAIAQLGAQSAVASLNEMTSVSTRMVAAFDGAEGAAGAAERAFTGARDFRMQAESQEAAANAGLLRTTAAVRQGDAAGASTQSNASTAAAAASRSAAIGSAASATTAKIESIRVLGFQVDAARLQADVDKFGTNRQQFETAAASRRQAIEAVDGTTTALAAQAEFFDDVVQALSSRAKTEAATAAGASSTDARSQTLAIAAQLTASVQQARQMEQTASTNAGRMFGRSMGSYVGRAQAAAAGAENQAIMANAAASRAETSASSARQIAADRD